MKYFRHKIFAIYGIYNMLLLAGRKLRSLELANDTVHSGKQSVCEIYTNHVWNTIRNLNL